MDSFYSMYNKKKRNNISFFSKIIIYNKFKNSHGNIFAKFYILFFLSNLFFELSNYYFQMVNLSIYKYHLFMNYCCLYESPKMSVFVLRMNHIFATSSLILFKIWFLFSFCCCCCCCFCCLLFVFLIFFGSFLFFLLEGGFLSRFLCMLLGLNV